MGWFQSTQCCLQSIISNFFLQKAVQASPKNRFSWHVWALFEAEQGSIDKARKLLKIGHAVNPRDPVILQSLALLEYNYSSPNTARVLFRKASQIDPRHQPVWIVWIFCAYLSFFYK
jgi:Tfp pilus assembly protein PilF